MSFKEQFEMLPKTPGFEIYRALIADEMMFQTGGRLSDSDFEGYCRLAYSLFLQFGVSIFRAVEAVVATKGESPLAATSYLSRQ